MTTRYDVSQVPPQGGYVAKRCPVRAQNDVLQPCEPLQASEILQRLWHLGKEFEAGVFAELRELHPDARFVREEGGAADRELATTDAMDAGAELILGGRLPIDEDGRRAGEPDLLVAAQGGGGYRAVDVKYHSTLAPDPNASGSMQASVTELARPAFESADGAGEAAARKRKDDLLQLAHYQRMLEAGGLAPAGGRFAGIIGTERWVTWYDLDLPVWRTPSWSGKQKLRSTMEIYEFEFDFRLDIISVAQSHLADPSVEPLVVPRRMDECDECPWRDHCFTRLEAGSGDVSLIPRVGWKEWKAHRERGVTDRAALAALDLPTAQLVAGGVDVAVLIQAAEGQDPSAAIADLPPFNKRPKQIATLADAGVVSVADVASLDVATAAYSDCSMSTLPEQIDQARAALGPAPAYRRRGVGALSAPRGDIEVDVDMENDENGVYLWGALVTDRCGLGVEEGYRPFATWGLLTPEGESALFGEFWGWLTGLRRQAADAGRSFRAYCYNASAENGELLKLSLTAGVLDEVKAFIASDEWVDMLRVVNEQLITGAGTGLKAAASLAGFEWEVEEPGGGESMVWRDKAVGAESEAEREEAMKWLLTYNRNDVQATLALREWLCSSQPVLPRIEDAPGAR